jgi:pycsar effector protein
MKQPEMICDPKPVAEATQNVRGELARVDSKAGTLLALAGTALSVVLAVLARTALPPAAAVAGWVTAGLIAAAVIVLASAIRPNLNGDHGFVHYAQITPQQLGDEFAMLDDRQRTAVLVDMLGQLSRAAYVKYRRVQVAVDLLLAGLAGIAITVTLTALL